MFGNIIFRQLFDPASSTYTYVVGDPQSLQAVIIDTVFEQHFRDRALLEELGLKLLATLDQPAWYQSSEDYAKWAAATFQAERGTIERVGLLLK